MDTLSEELRVKRKQITDLETERGQFLQYREQLLGAIHEKDALASENKKIREDLMQTQEELADIKKKRQIETDKFKKSFDEMDSLIEKEREAHKLEEDKLKQINKQLENKIVLLTSSLDEFNNERSQFEKLSMQQLESHKESKRQLMEGVERAKQREMEYEAKCREAKNEASILQTRCIDLESANEKFKAEVFKLSQYQSLFNIEKEKVLLLRSYG